MPVIALFVTWKQLGFFILLYLAALQNVPKELYESAVDRRRRHGAGRSGTSPCPASGRRPRWCVILATITGANLFTEPYLLTNGGGPNGASTSPVLVMYQKGIEQGNPDTAAGDRRDPRDRRAADLAGQQKLLESGLTMTRTPSSSACDAPAARVALLAWAPLLFLFPFYYMLDRLAAEASRTPRWRARSRPAASRWTTTRDINEPGRPGRSRWSTRASSPAASCSARSSSACSPATRWRGCTSAAGARCSRSMLLVQIVPVPAADHPALRDDRAQLRAGRLLPRDDRCRSRSTPPRSSSSGSSSCSCPRSCSPPPASTAPASCASCGRSRCPWCGRRCSPRPAHLHRAVERVPLAVPGHQGGRPAAARGLARQLHQQRRRPGGQPVRRDPRRRLVLAAPAVALFVAFQKHFIASDIGSGVKG